MDIVDLERAYVAELPELTAANDEVPPGPADTLAHAS